MRKLLNLLSFLLLVSSLVRSEDLTLNDDVLGLIAFMADLHDPRSKLVSWNVDDSSPCGWDGVRCDPRASRVTELALDGFSLSGHIGRGLLRLQFLRQLSMPRNNFTGGVDPDLARLASLQTIDLSENALSGQIPDELFRKCSSLRSISLANNLLSGPVPPSLGSCSTLVAVNLSSNQLSGQLPPQLWSLRDLRLLDLSDNSLSGEIPDGIDELSNLRTMSLRKNKLSGRLPDGFGGCLLLKSLDLSENSLSGALPHLLRKLSMCSYLSLRSNSLAGAVPSWIGEMSSLESLDVSGNEFSGSIPSSLGNLSSLKTLNFSRNGFTGSLPNSILGCGNLHHMDFSRNSLTGNLPTWAFEGESKRVWHSSTGLMANIEGHLGSSLEEGLHKSLETLDLSDNMFLGFIPLGIVDFSNLRILNMSQNSLAGPIPASIGDLKALEVLDLSKNQLNGSIPSEIGAAVRLRVLRLENNSLSGDIPVTIGNCSSLTCLILSRNCLRGPLPPSIANLSNLQIVDVSVNNLIGPLPKQLSNLLHLLSFNISYNHLKGELPSGGFFNTISPSSVAGNPSLCGSAVNRSCPTVLPKPIVLNPNSSSDASGSGPLPSNLRHKKIILSISSLVAIGAAALIALGVITVTILNLRVRSLTSPSAAALNLSHGDEDFSQSPATDVNSGKLVMFSGDPDFSAGTHALLNKDCELGRGGFGAVYRAVLRDGRPVAIKKLTVSSLVKSQDDFEREVKKLGKVRHHNLVTLEGFYWTQSLQLLISEFVSGGSLYKHLHENSAADFLSWHDRFNVILGTAKGLCHLHQLNIIHYNMKSSNVLIDCSGEPKIGDFGLAKLLPMLDRYALSSKIQSALGYMAPEFACRTVKITEKCDVYGFGVLVLEVVTGRRPVEYMEDDVVVLCDMVRGALEEGRIDECVDERLLGKFPVEEAVPVMKLGLICTSHVPSNRPDMGEVVNILELIRCPSHEQEGLG